MVIHHFICYGDCSCIILYTGSRNKTIPLFKKLPQFSSKHKSLFQCRLTMRRRTIPKPGFAKRTKRNILTFFFFYKMRIILVFWSFLFNFLMMSKKKKKKNEWVDIQYVFCQSILFSICTQFLSILKKDRSDEKKNKSKTKNIRHLYIISSNFSILGTINQFHLLDIIIKILSS